MAKPVVTQERVFEIADSLTERGEDPTILSVQAAIGGGSYSTVKRYIDIWKEAERRRRSHAALPDAAIDRLMTLGREFWTLLEERSAQQLEQLRLATGDEIAALEVQMRQAEQAIAKLEGEKEALEQLAAERETATQALRAEFQVERERATAAEAKTTQLDARVVDLKAQLDRVLKQEETQRLSAEAERAEAKKAAIENARLHGELTALRR